MTFYKDLKDQMLLLPPNIRDMIPKNHICHLVDKIIQNMDLADIEKRYEGAEHPAYHPKIILKLLILGQIDGIRSSRKSAKMLRYPIFQLTVDFYLKTIIFDFHCTF